MQKKKNEKILHSMCEVINASMSNCIDSLYHNYRYVIKLVDNIAC